MYFKIGLFFLFLLVTISSVYSATTISSLPYSINSSGDYNISGNLISTTDGILINASNVSLNCEGFTISGDRGAGDYGIEIINSNNKYNNITNCNILSFERGIYLSSSYNNTFRNFISYNNSQYGIYLSVSVNNSFINFSSNNNTLDGFYLSGGSTYNNFNDFSIYNNSQFGFYLYIGANRNNFNNFNTSKNQVGLRIYRGDYNVFNNFNVYNNTFAGIYFYDFPNVYCNFTNFNVYNNNGVGIYITGASYMNFINFSSYSNSQEGIYVGGSQYNNFTNFSSYSNSQEGIEFWAGSSNKFDLFKIYNNLGNGIYLQQTSSNNFSNFNITNNTGGINLHLSNYNYFFNSKVYSNSQNNINIWQNTDDSCNTIITNVTDNLDKFHIYSNLSVNIDSWTNLSSLVLCKANNSIVRNINFEGDGGGVGVIVYKTGYSNFSNIFVSKYYKGISNEYSSSYNTYNNLNISNITTYGFYSFGGISNSYNLNLSNFIINTTQYGIHFTYYVHRNVLINITSYNNSYFGIYLVQSDNNTLDNITSYDNLRSGIYFSSSLNNIINNLNSYNNLQYGVSFESNSNNNTIGNIISYNNTYSGIFLSSSSYNRLTNINSSRNTLHGVHLLSSNYNNLTNFNVTSNTQKGVYFESGSQNRIINFNILSNTGYGAHLYSNSMNNTFFNGSLLNNVAQNIYFQSFNIYYPSNNTFYNNYLANASKIGSNNWALNLNFFNSSLSGYNIGNYWNNLSTCVSSEIRGTYEVCLNPSNYSVNTSHIDYAPLVIPTISVAYVTGPSGNYYSESIYIEVNATKNISSCVLYFNGTPSVMSVNNNNCYTTASGTFGNYYEYNVSVVGVNTAVAMTNTKNITLVDLSLDYTSPPTPLNNVKKYDLSILSVEFSDNGGSFTNCMVQINGLNYSMTYSGGNCIYNYTIADFNTTTTSVSFQGFYNISGTVTALEERTVTIYGLQTNQNQIPAFGLTSIILFILTIIGGIIFN